MNQTRLEIDKKENFPFWKSFIIHIDSLTINAKSVEFNKLRDSSRNFTS